MPRDSTASRRRAPASDAADDAPATPARGRKRAAPTAEADPKSEPNTPSRSSKRARTQPVKSYKEEEDDDGVEAEASSKATKPTSKTTPKKAATKSKSKKDDDSDANSDDDDDDDSDAKQDADRTTKPKPKAARKSAARKAEDAMPLATRTAGTLHRLGAHVSAAGGVQNAVTNAVHIGANAFALFLKSQRKWANPPLKPEHATAFTDGCKSHTYDAAAAVLPHGSYLVNLANPEPDKAAQAYAGFLDDLQRCDALGIRLYNFHPGNTNGAPRAEAIARLAAQLNKAHKATTSVVTVLENMAAAPTANTLGGRFEDLRDTIALVDDKARVGVCLDTCHAFAAGYDLRARAAWDATLAHFDATVGLRFLRALHVNDSKGVLGSHRDLHQNIGAGFLGLRAFHNMMNDPRVHGLPLILETPIDVKDDKGKSVEDKGIWAREIKLLESLVGMDPEGDEFKRLEAELSEKGVVERVKLQEQFERKMNSPVKKRGAKK